MNRKAEGSRRRRDPGDLMIPILIIAGSDTSGGAGIQADVRTVAALGGHAFTVVTALTAQNSTRITAIHEIPSPFIREQVAAVVEDAVPRAVKIGMLYSAEAVREVADLLRQYRFDRVVLDPVFRASTGRRLLAAEAVFVLKEQLLPLVTVVTPNLAEAALLSGMAVEGAADMKRAAAAIHGAGPHVVVTGGHLKEDCVDLLYDGAAYYRFSGPRIETRHTHGTGCVFSTALAVFLGRGKDLPEAVRSAHEAARRAIAGGYACGAGAGPVDPGRGMDRDA